MKKIKEEKGAITILVIITMLFFVSFLVVTYIFVSNKADIQIESTKQVKDMYEQDANEIYNGYFANNETETNVTIPIYTVEQLLKIGSNEYLQINEVGGKYYYFSPLATYILMNNLNFESDEWQIDELESINFDWNNNKITINGEEFPIDYTYIIKNLRNRKILAETDELSEETLNKIYVAQKETGLSMDCFSVIKEEIDGVVTEYVVYLYGIIYAETYVKDEDGIGDGVASYNVRVEKIKLLNELTDGMLAGDVDENGKIEQSDSENIMNISSYTYDFSKYAQNDVMWLMYYYNILGDCTKDLWTDGGDSAIIDFYVEGNESISVNLIYKYDIENCGYEIELQAYNY